MSTETIKAAHEYLAEHEAKADGLEVEALIAEMKAMDYHPVETNEDTFAVVTTGLTTIGLNRLYALLKLDDAISRYRDPD